MNSQKPAVRPRSALGHRALCAMAGSLFFGQLLVVPLESLATTLTPLPVYIDANTALLTHSAGGSASDPSGSNSAAFGPVGSASFFVQSPTIFPPGGGISQVAVFSGLANYANVLENPFVPFNYVSFDTLLYISQAAVVQRNGTISTVSGDASLSSVIEFVVPDFGPNTGLLWGSSLGFSQSLPNGGSGTASGTATLENVTAATTLVMSATSGFSTTALLLPAPGDVIRLTFEGTASGTVLAGSNSPFGSSRALFENQFGVVSVPEPSTAALASIGLLAGLAVTFRRQQVGFRRQQVGR